MNRYVIIKDEVYRILTTDCSKNKRKDGLDHLFSVTTMCQYLARINNLDIEIAAIIGILHDIATYKFNSSFDHANRSAMIANDFLKKEGLFTNEEISTIVTAIRNHSHKERIDDPYSELIKDADTLVLYLSDSQAILSNEKQARINQLLGDK